MENLGLTPFTGSLLKEKFEPGVTDPTWDYKAQILYVSNDLRKADETRELEAEIKKLTGYKGEGEYIAGLRRPSLQNYLNNVITPLTAGTSNEWNSFLAKYKEAADAAKNKYTFSFVNPSIIYPELLKLAP